MDYLHNLLQLVKQGKVQTSYSHDTCISSDESDIAIDCSGLVDLWLKKEYPQAREELFNYVLRVRDTKKYQITRLYSFDFYDFFNSDDINNSKYWQKVAISEKLCAGDIIAFINPDDFPRWGHMVIVEQEIVRTNEKITLKIIDSSKYCHFEDWHQSDRMGIGTGIIELFWEEGVIKKVCYGPDCQRIRLCCVGRLCKKIKKNEKNT